MTNRQHGRLEVNQGLADYYEELESEPDYDDVCDCSVCNLCFEYGGPLG